MARTHGRVQTAIWTDDDFRALDVPAQRAYLLLISQPQINNCGVLPYVPKRWAKLAAGDNVHELEDAIANLEHACFVLVDRDTDELLVRTFIRHDRIVAQPNLVKSARVQFQEIESLPIKATIWHEHKPLWEPPWEPLPKPLSQSLEKALPEPLSARTRVRSRAGTRTSPAPTPTPEEYQRNRISSIGVVSPREPASDQGAQPAAAHYATPDIEFTNDLTKLDIPFTTTP